MLIFPSKTSFCSQIQFILLFERVMWNWHSINLSTDPINLTIFLHSINLVVLLGDMLLMTYAATFEANFKKYPPICYIPSTTLSSFIICTCRYALQIFFLMFFNVHQPFLRLKEYYQAQRNLVFLNSSNWVKRRALNHSSDIGKAWDEFDVLIF